MVDAICTQTAATGTCKSWALDIDQRTTSMGYNDVSLQKTGMAMAIPPASTSPALSLSYGLPKGQQLFVSVGGVCAAEISLEILCVSCVQLPCWLAT